jgi:hypothetical protein
MEYEYHPHEKEQRQDGYESVTKAKGRVDAPAQDPT